jgi:hypothetical protein
MAVAIELCRTCGFDIPLDAGECPGCTGRAPTAPPLAARQAAGLALPTRSVHRLPRTRPRKDAVTRPVGPARAARSAFSFTSSLALFTLVAAAATWLSTQPRFVLQLPAGTTDLLDRVTTVSATASLVGLGLGIAAMLEWCTRAAWLKLAARRRARS